VLSTRGGGSLPQFPRGLKAVPEIAENLEYKLYNCQFEGFQAKGVGIGRNRRGIIFYKSFVKS
jgi:hypothetical protein